MAEEILNTEEFAVYVVIKKYLGENHFFMMEDIIRHLDINVGKTLNLSVLKIEKILKSLLKKHLIAPRSKLVRDDVLKNQKRKEIYKFIDNYPGTYLYEIIKSVDLGTHQSLWHLNILKKFLLIRAVQLDNHEVYFNFSLEPEHDFLLYYLRNNKVKKLLRLLENDHEGLYPTNISEQLKMHYDTTRKYLKVLSDLNLVSIVNENNKKLYKLNKEIYSKNLELVKRLTEIIIS